MTLLTKEQIEQLAAQRNGPRVSIYLPTHRAGRETSQDPIRLKNLLAGAEQELVAQGMRSATAQELLQPATDLLNDRQFWLHQSDGLAVFLAANGMRAFRLPLRVEELRVVSPYYHVKPLLGLLGRDGRFFVLAISLQRVRLFEARRDTIREIDLWDIPQTLRDAVGYDWAERSLQFHTGAGPGKGGMRRAMFHGHGSPKDDAKQEITTFLRLVDEGVTALLRGERIPLVLAGVEYVMAIYRSVTSYPDVLPDGVEGNADDVSPEELLTRAWPVVKPRFIAEQRIAAERYEALVGTGRASSDLTEVLRAAFAGRVETLLAALDTQRWGTFDETSQRAEVHPERRPGDGDLVDLAAIRALATGADVYAVEPERVPGRGAVAATFRY